MSIEWLLCFLMVASVGLILLLKAGLRQGVLWGLILLPGAALLAGAFQWNSHHRQKTGIQTQILNTLPRADRAEEFVSSDTCQSCHPSQYGSWHQSFHRTMTQV